MAFPKWKCFGNNWKSKISLKIKIKKNDTINGHLCVFQSNKISIY